jgi:uncharacterized protein YutE (UPF0331/DUF86 family)
MTTEFSGIERRLDELSERLARLEPLKNKSLEEFLQDAYLRDIVERNLEIAAQACIDICHRLIALGNARKPVDYYEAFLIVGEMGILPGDFARRLASMAGFRNILVHEYLQVDWDLVYENLQRLEDLYRFREYVVHWLRK